MRIWNEIELYKSGEKSSAFLANNLYFIYYLLFIHIVYLVTLQL